MSDTSLQALCYVALRFVMLRADHIERRAQSLKLTTGQTNRQCMVVVEGKAFPRLERSPSTNLGPASLFDDVHCRGLFNSIEKSNPGLFSTLAK